MNVTYWFSLPANAAAVYELRCRLNLLQRSGPAVEERLIDCQLRELAAKLITI
jgi:hypothetical protein